MKCSLHLGDFKEHVCIQGWRGLEQDMHTWDAAYKHTRAYDDVNIHFSAPKITFKSHRILELHMFCFF